MTRVLWSELQVGLSGAGLKAKVYAPSDGLWTGEIDEKPFTMSVPGLQADNKRDWLIVSLYGQDEKEVLAGLNRFIGYEPICKYKHKINSKASATYEWDRKDPQGRLDELLKDENVHDLEKLVKQNKG